MEESRRHRDQAESSHPKPGTGAVGGGGGVAVVVVWYAALVLAALVLTGYAAGLYGAGELDAVAVTVGVLGLLVVLALCPIAVLMFRRMRGGSTLAEVRRHHELLDAIGRLADQAALSDDARGVLNRQRERELLRLAIEEDVAAEDWDAAIILVNELANRFGYRADAEEFRERIEKARHEVVGTKVNAAISLLDGLIIQRRWESALAEAARIARLYPDSPRVEGLRDRVEQARGAYKSDLERRFLTAAQSDDIDEAMELLKELDAYLTPDEAEKYREVARGVIGKARENLGAQFQLAVRDRQWAVARSVGERIITEFPNTRMAEEVRGVIDGIRQRATAMA